VILDENTKQTSSNPYGSSKRAIEEMLRDFAVAHGLGHVIYRYFNVAGAYPAGEVGKLHQPETHLIPLMLDVVSGKRPVLTLFGTDYPTPDGTCIRDYVHVSDLVEAHVLGLRWLEDGKGSRVFCLGMGGAGFSVREVVSQARAVTNQDVPINIGPRRPGDAVSLVSGLARAINELGWAPSRSSMQQMISDAWRWHENYHYNK
jgi:UDP-glucose 4-epimerase